MPTIIRSRIHKLDISEHKYEIHALFHHHFPEDTMPFPYNA